MKLNVFHWHFSDAQSFSYQSEVKPRLSEFGAYSPKAAYSRSQVAEVVKYGLARGIRIVPEFDVPAHSASWGKGYPELIAPCVDTLKEGVKNGDLEKQIDKVAMRPLADTTWKFLEEFFEEILDTFPDQYIHLGTDEVNGDCWVADPDVAAYSQENGYDWRSKLEVQFRRRLERLLLKKARQAESKRKRPVRFVLWDSDSLDDVDIVAPDDESEDSDSAGVAIAQTWRFWESYQAHRLHGAGYVVANDSDLILGFFLFCNPF